MVTRTRIPLAKEQTGDRQINALQDNAAQAARAVNAMPFASGYLVESLVFAAGQTLTVNHKLGRKVRGYIVVRATAAPALYEVSTGDTLTIAIKSTNAGTFSVWFF